MDLEAKVEARAAEVVRLYQDREAAAEEKAVVDEVARIVTSTLDIDQVYEKFVTEVKKLVDFDRTSIAVIDHHAATFTAHYVSGVYCEGREAYTDVPLDGTQAERVLRASRPPPEGGHPDWRQVLG